MFEKDCTVRFVAGSRLEFGEAAFMIIKGKPIFLRNTKLYSPAKMIKIGGAFFFLGQRSKPSNTQNFRAAMNFCLREKDIRAP